MSKRIDPIASEAAQSMFARYLIVVDSGNGWNNGARAMPDGRVRQVNEMSLRSPATMLSTGAEMEIDADWTWFEDRYWITGPDVLTYARDAASTHVSKMRAGNPHHMFFIAKTIADLGVKDGETVDLVTFAPPGYLAESTAEINRAIAARKGLLTVQRCGKDKITFKIKSNTVYPEGVMAAWAYALDKHGDQQAMDHLKGRRVVLDGGLYTFDSVIMINGDISPQSLDNATFPDNGTNRHMLIPLKREIHKNRALRHITERDVDLALFRAERMKPAEIQAFIKDKRNDETTGDLNVFKRVEVDIDGVNTLDITEAANFYASEYAGWITDNVIAASGDLDGIAGVVPAGGSMTYVLPYLELWHGHRVMVSSPGQTPYTRSVHHADLTMIGGLRHAIMKRNEKLNNGRRRPKKRKQGSRGVR